MSAEFHLQRDVRMTNLLLPAMGLVLLFMGRRLFWFFVAVLGFAAGLQAAPLLLDPAPFWMVWAVGLVFGVIGALLALFFQQVAIIAGGFLSGVSLSLHLLPAANTNLLVTISLLCGIASAVALWLFFDWVLILLSTLIGASLIIDGIGWQAPFAIIGYVLLVAAGVGVQGRWLRARRGPAG